MKRERERERQRHRERERACEHNDYSTDPRQEISMLIVMASPSLV